MADAFSVDRLAWSEQSIVEGYVENLRSRSSPLVLFGAGEAGVAAKKTLNHFGIQPDFFCDNNPKKQGTKCEDVPVIGFEELANTYRDSHIIITSLSYREVLREQLRENGLREFCDGLWLVDRIWLLEDMESRGKRLYQALCDSVGRANQIYGDLADGLSRQIFYDVFNYRISLNPQYLIPYKSAAAQYFEPGVITLGDQEVFIDGGAFTGDTVEEFLLQTGNRFKEVYSFEPDTRWQAEYDRKFGRNKDIHLLPYGLWSKASNLRFAVSEENPAASRISDGDGGSASVPVTSIDEVLKGRPATFIKLDIEGSELEALNGAKQTIKEYRPKLAICVYHKTLDVIEIPHFIKALAPEYKLYLRHYSSDHNETVLYAIP